MSEDKSTVAYWRGTVDQQLKTLTDKVGDMHESMEVMREQLGRLDKKLGNGTTFIEWKFIREKMAVPLVLAFLTFLLFTILPAVIVLIYFLPRIAELK